MSWYVGLKGSLKVKKIDHISLVHMSLTDNTVPPLTLSLFPIVPLLPQEMLKICQSQFNFKVLWLSAPSIGTFRYCWNAATRPSLGSELFVFRGQNVVLNAYFTCFCKYQTQLCFDVLPQICVMFSSC